MSSLRLWSQNPLLSPQRIQCQSGTEHETHFLGHDWKRNLLQGFIAAAKVSTLTRVDVRENIVVSARQNRNENETWSHGHPVDGSILSSWSETAALKAVNGGQQ